MGIAFGGGGDGSGKKIGTNVDAAGTSSVFARLKQIYDNVALGNIKSIQRGSTQTGVDKTVTISAVNTAKSFVIPSGQGPISNQFTFALTSSTSLSYYNGQASNTGYAYWEVVEFY